MISICRWLCVDVIISKRAKTSSLLSYFTSIDNNFTKCDICGKKCSYKSTTSNLRKHIKRIHPAINFQEGKLNIIQPDVQLRDPDNLDEEPDQNKNAAEASASASIAPETLAPDEPTREQSTHIQTDITTYIPKK
jgi:hypothetical protein